MPAAFGFAPALPAADALDAVRQGAALVTAGNRLARAFREQFSAARLQSGERVWQAPQILSWDAWLGALYEQRLYASAMPALLSPEQELLLWEEAIRLAPDSQDLISVSSTAAAARQSWGLMHAWRIGRRELEGYSGGDTATFLAWARSFEERCAEGGWIDPARLPDELSPVLGERDLPPHIVVAGFDELAPQQAEFLDACRRAGVAVSQVGSAGCVPAQVRRVACLNRRDELVQAARWARALLESGADGIAVVVPDLEKRRREAERIFLDVLHPAAILPGEEPRRRAFNISAGAPLSDYPAVRAAFLALALQPAGNPIGRTGALLLSAYIRGAARELSRRAALDARLRKIGAASISVAALVSQTPPECKHLLRALSEWQRVRETLPERQSPGAWAGAFSRLLEALGWPGEGLSSADYQATQKWSALLADFARLDAAGGPMSYGAALSRLERMAGETIFQPESVPAPVQVLGALEAAGARFNHLWVAGMDDETWPAPARPDPFLPIALQKKYNLPHSSPRRELEFARRRLNALLASAPVVTLSWAKRERDADLGPSPLIRDVEEVPLEALELPSFASLLDVSACGASLERFEDTSGPPVQTAAEAGGGSSILKHQAECPFRAFSEHRLGARPLETPEDGLDPRGRGILVHSALEKIWDRLRSHAALAAASADELAGIVGSAVDCAVAELEARRAEPLPRRFAGIERERLKALLLEWLEREREREPFEVLALEHEQEVEIGGLRAKLKIDRIDRLASGREVIIDYKTGDVRPSDWNGERMTEPQVPLYAVTHSGDVQAAAFGLLRGGSARFVGLSSNPPAAPGLDAVDDIEGQKQRWRDALEKLARDFMAGYAAVDPRKGTRCGKCPISPLCRVQEAKLNEAGENGEGE